MAQRRCCTFLNLAYILVATLSELDPRRCACLMIVCSTFPQVPAAPLQTGASGCTCRRETTRTSERLVQQRCPDMIRPEAIVPSRCLTACTFASLLQEHSLLIRDLLCSRLRVKHCMHVDRGVGSSMSGSLLKAASSRLPPRCTSDMEHEPLLPLLLWLSLGLRFCVSSCCPHTSPISSHKLPPR